MRQTCSLFVVGCVGGGLVGFVDEFADGLGVFGKGVSRVFRRRVWRGVQAFYGGPLEDL